MNERRRPSPEQSPWSDLFSRIAKRIRTLWKGQTPSVPVAEKPTVEVILLPASEATGPEAVTQEIAFRVTQAHQMLSTRLLTGNQRAATIAQLRSAIPDLDLHLPTIESNIRDPRKPLNLLTDAAVLIPHRETRSGVVIPETINREFGRVVFGETEVRLDFDTILSARPDRTVIMPFARFTLPFRVFSFTRELRYDDPIIKIGDQVEPLAGVYEAAIVLVAQPNRTMSFPYEVRAVDTLRRLWTPESAERIRDYLETKEWGRLSAWIQDMRYPYEGGLPD